ncbi:HNH endonuclease [Muricoccus nepalensis]|nr:HNH endonuclease [Roseomonas nepalensis]
MDAKAFIDQRVFSPALNSQVISGEVKAVVRNSRSWVNQFRRVGDLLQYFDRFKGEGTSKAFIALRQAGLSTFEDVLPEFYEKFEPWRSDCTRLDDFVVGQIYSPRSILAFAGVYDSRAGGILPIGKVGTHRAVFIKATMTGGKYNNTWLPDGTSLKYYLKSIQGNFGDHYQDNQSISKYPDIPIYAFTRNKKDDNFKFSGIFKSVRIHIDPDQSKWFELHRSDVAGHEILTSEDQYFRSFDQLVAIASASSSEERARRLAAAPKKPKRRMIVSYNFERNADVVAEVLAQAAGICGGCGSEAPFTRNSDGTPYLEVHHRRPLAAGGADCVENAIALCPNCHRREHNGPARWPWLGVSAGRS